MDSIIKKKTCLVFQLLEAKSLKLIKKAECDTGNSGSLRIKEYSYPLAYIEGKRCFQQKIFTSKVYKVSLKTLLKESRRMLFQLTKWRFMM